MAETKSIKSEAKTGAMAKDAGGTDEVKAPAKPSKITRQDWAKVESWLKEEQENRKQSDFRRSAEGKWKEIDRQIAMNPMVKVMRDGSEVDPGWHNVVELGELSKASENLSADVRRIIFPQTRYFFEPHVELELPLNPQTGEPEKNPKLLEKENGRLRSFMTQQHEDFGLKDRVELSIKEALHHGGFVAEIDWDEQEFVFDAVKVKKKAAPVWIPHSMWNCYPDPSPSVIGTNIFYSGSMFVDSFVPRHIAERMVKEGGDGWMAAQWKKVSKDTHKGKDNEKIKDVKLTTYWGDIYIDRADETLYFPNHKAVLANGTIVYMAPNKTPYSPIIYRGYERTDVRDPYYTSPIIKQSPMQKLGSQMANKMVDGVELALEPPIVYDGNDPDFVINGGPKIGPGEKVSTKGNASFKTIEVGDPAIALQALQYIVGEMKEKLGRPGRPVGDRATKAEVVKAAQDQEVSMIDFIDKMEIALRSYLYMQHAMNLADMHDYSYHSREMSEPDFLIMTKKQLPKAVHFEVVGARGVLGEEERTQKMSVVTAFAAGNALFAPLLERKAILMQMYQDAGVRNPEQFIVDQSHIDPAQLQMQIQQLTQAVQKMGAELQQEKQKSGVKMAKIQSDHQIKTEKLRTDHADRVMKIKTDAMLKAEQLNKETRNEVARLRHEITSDMRNFMAERVDKAREEATNRAEKSGDENVKHALGALAKAFETLAKNQEEMRKEMGRPKGKTMKAKKVNGEWQAEVTEH